MKNMESKKLFIILGDFDVKVVSPVYNYDWDNDPIKGMRPINQAPYVFVKVVCLAHHEKYNLNKGAECTLKEVCRKSYSKMSKIEKINYIREAISYM